MTTATQQPDGSWELQINVTNDQYWELVRSGSWAEMGPAETAEIWIKTETNEKLRKHNDRMDKVLRAV